MSKHFIGITVTLASFTVLSFMTALIIPHILNNQVNSEVAINAELY
jgi:branched-subunit amino acid transport protein